MGADIADILIRWKLGSPSYVTPKTQAPLPDELYADNPVMREVMKYISPQYWENMDALSRELELELIKTSWDVLEHDNNIISSHKY